MSYDEVLHYERCSAFYQGINIPGLESEHDYSMQAIADNVDHNTKTLDGKSTFHGMGIIVAVTPKLRLTTFIPRFRKVQSDELVKLAHIESRILPFCKRPKMKFTELLDLPLLDICSVDYQSTSTWFLNSSQPLWSGFM